MDRGGWTDLTGTRSPVPTPEVGCPRDPSEEDSVEGGPEQLLRHREWGVHLVS